MGEPIQTEQVEIIDGEGRVRARLGSLKGDRFGPHYGLALYGPGGEHRGSFALGPSGPYLLLDDEGDNGVFVTVYDRGGPEAGALGPRIIVGGGDGPEAHIWPDLLAPLHEAAVEAEGERPASMPWHDQEGES